MRKTILPAAVLACLALAAAANAGPIGELSFGPNSADLPGGIGASGPSDVYGYSFRITNAATPIRTGPGMTGFSTGTPTGSEVTVTKRLDAMSPKLFRAVATGQTFPSARLDIFATSSDADYSYCLTTVRATSDAHSGAELDGTTERITLAFARMTQVFEPPSPFGPVSGSWDVFLTREPAPACPATVPSPA